MRLKRKFSKQFCIGVKLNNKALWHFAEGFLKDLSYNEYKRIQFK